MSILSTLNAITGKNADDIEEAVGDLGDVIGGGGSESVKILQGKATYVNREYVFEEKLSMGARQIVELMMNGVAVHILFLLEMPGNNPVYKYDEVQLVGSYVPGNSSSQYQVQGKLNGVWMNVGDDGTLFWGD